MAAFQGSRPDWPSVSRTLATALEEFAIAQSQAEADVRAHDQLRDEYDRARQELDRVARLLSSRQEDRVAANQHFRAAAEVLDQVGLDLSSSRGEWARLLERVRGAGNDLEQAERLAQEDIRLAGQAESELAEASRSIRQAREYSAMGVTVDTSARKPPWIVRSSSFRPRSTSRRSNVPAMRSSRRGKPTRRRSSRHRGGRCRPRPSVDAGRPATTAPR